MSYTKEEVIAKALEQGKINMAQAIHLLSEKPVTCPTCGTSLKAEIRPITNSDILSCI